MRGLTLAIQRHNQGQTHRDLRRGNCDNEEHEHLTIEIAIEAGKSDQREIGRIQHQLQAHIDDQQVPANRHAEQSKAKQDNADHQVVLEANAHFRSFLLSRITPTMATRSNKETISKGNRNRVKSTFPKGIVLPSSVGDGLEGRADRSKVCRKTKRIAPAAMMPEMAENVLMR